MGYRAGVRSVHSGLDGTGWVLLDGGNFTHKEVAKRDGWLGMEMEMR
jgi:hypothetical protein